MLKLYGAVTSTPLDKLRYIVYTRSVSRPSLSSGFKLESLPPTSAAAKFHSNRAYLAVQQWIGDNLGPTDWGWQYRDGMLVPLTTDRPVAPTRVLRIVSCGCNTGCRKTCGCPRAGLYCSPLVQLLQWTHMHNIHALAVSQDSDNASHRCECYNSCHVSVLNFVCALFRSFFLLFVSKSIIYAYAH